MEGVTMNHGLMKIFVKSNRALGDLYNPENTHIVAKIANDLKLRIPVCGIYVVESININTVVVDLDIYYIISMKISAIASSMFMIYASKDETAARHMLSVLASNAFSTGSYTMD